MSVFAAVEKLGLIITAFAKNFKKNTGTI